VTQLTCGERGGGEWRAEPAEAGQRQRGAHLGTEERSCSGSDNAASDKAAVRTGALYIGVRATDSAAPLGTWRVAA
jgi:hypothetical protein